MKNPALSQESRFEPAKVIPLKNDSSLLEWLRASDRIIEREVVKEIASVEEDPEFDGLIEEDSYESDDEDNSDTLDE
ncbi:MAG: DUF3134 domain-containing protein [Cyanobacteria bacterium P01_H01_bin.15]